jgi:hypothetical protein
MLVAAEAISDLLSNGDGPSVTEKTVRLRATLKVKPLPLLTLDVRVTQRFGIQAAASVPDVTRSAVIPRSTGAFDFSETFSGLGDMSVVAWYKLRPIRQWYPVVNFGSSIPTGRTEAPRFRTELQDGSLVPMSRLQRGTGTVDPLVGANAGRRFGKMTAFASVAARLPLYENADGLRTGASAETNAGIAA